MTFFEMFAENIGTITKTVGALVGGVVGFYIITILLRIYFYKQMKNIQKDYTKKIHHISEQLNELDKKLNKLIRKK